MNFMSRVNLVDFLDFPNLCIRRGEGLAREGDVVGEQVSPGVACADAS